MPHQSFMEVLNAAGFSVTNASSKSHAAGGELFRYLDIEGAFTDTTARFYAANVLLALEHLHSLGVVYRDLKPENLLLDTDGYVKVADFGFAKLIGARPTFTICGTPDYQV